MPFKIKYKGDVEIEAATATDLESLLDLLDRRSASNGELPKADVSDRMSELVLRLTDQNLQFLRLLDSGGPGGLSDADICAALHLESRRNIGGLVMGISKKATALGIDVDKYVVTKRVDRAADGERAYTYRLRPEAHTALEALNALQR